MAETKLKKQRKKLNKILENKDSKDKEKKAAKESIKSIDKEKKDMSLYLDLLKIFSTTPQPNVPLEKEVAYLQGKVDILEKIIIGR